MDLIFFALLFILAIFSILIRPIFMFIGRYPWIALILIAAALAASATSKQRRRTAFDRLVSENLPFLISFIFARSDRKRDIVLNAKDILREHFEEKTVHRMMMLLKKCNENGITDGEVNNACFNLASTLSYDERYQLFEILRQIVGTGTVDEQNALNMIAVKLNLAYGTNGNTYESFYEFFRNFYNSQYSQSSGDTNGSQYHPRPDNYDPYKELGLTRDATNEEIKKAYRRLCKQYHPDKTAGMSDEEKAYAEKKIREIISAYDKIKQERPGL